MADAFMRVVNNGTKVFWRGTVTVTVPVFGLAQAPYPHDVLNSRKDGSLGLGGGSSWKVFLASQLTRFRRPFDSVPS
jgi:hypothetical protein